ncbi:hypothetical protein E0H46_31930 [Rhizobium leguminosarum bv. viciae]|nr:hypothetical protein E0H46_31930 [Rhizobium leguminosarum bv. viciae]
MSAHTPGPWFVSGVRIKMDRQVFHGIARYDEAKKQDETIACVGYDTRTGLGMADARLIAAAPTLIEALQEARTQIALLQSMRGIVDTGCGTLSIIDAALAKAGVKVETGEEVA